MTITNCMGSQFLRCVLAAISPWMASAQLLTLVDGSSGLGGPGSVAVDAHGNVYFGAAANVVAQWKATNHQVATLVPSAGKFAGDDIGVAVDGVGNVYFSSLGAGAVEKWDATTHQVSTLISSLYSPVGLAVDAAGNLYYGDEFQGTVNKWSMATRQVTTLVRSGSDSPMGVAVDQEGSVYITYYGGAVKRWNVANEQVTTLASAVNHAMGVAVDTQGNVYFSDVDTGNHASVLKKWSSQTHQVTTLVAANLKESMGLAADGTGNVYIAESGNNAVRVLLANPCVSPAIVTQPADQHISLGQTATLSLTASGSAPLHYQWYQGVPFTRTNPVGTDSSTFSIGGLTTWTPYWAIVANLCGTATSGEAGIYVEQPCIAPTITTQPQSQTIQAGTTAMLSVVGAGANLSFQWYQGQASDTSHPLGTTASITVGPLSATTNYWVRITNTCGWIDSSTTTMTVLPSSQLTVLGLEVTQAIQNLKNVVPLVAGKRTVIRAYLRSTNGTNVDNVRAQLLVRAVNTNGVTLLGTINPARNSITITPNAGQTKNNADRLSLDSSFTFALPALDEDPSEGAWTSGTVEFQLASDNQQLTCADTVPNCTVRVVFGPAPAIKIEFVGVLWTDALGKQWRPSADDVAQTILDIKATLPLPTVTWDYPYDIAPVYPGSLLGRAPTTQSDFGAINDSIAAARRSDGCGAECRTYYIGLIGGTPLAPSLFGLIGGYAGMAVSIPGYVASAFGSQRLAAAHELSHLLGRHHTTCTGTEADPDTGYPYTNPPGAIGGLAFSSPQTYYDEYWGFDVQRTAAAQHPAYPPAWRDLMSYCTEWPSDYTYGRILDFLRAQPSVVSTNSALQSAYAHAAVTGQAALVVQGTLSLDTVGGSIDNVLQLATAPDQPLPSAGSASLLAEDAAGNILAAYSFTPVPTSDDPAHAQFTIAFPTTLGIKQLVLVENGQTVATRSAPTHTPTVQLAAPLGGEVWQQGSSVVRWSGSDADGNALVYAVQYSPDNGAHWQLLATGLTDVQYTLAAGSLQPGAQAMIRVLASDGFNTGTAQSGAFTVIGAGPIVAITQPADGSVYVGDQFVTLRGMGYSRSSGGAGAAALVWTLDGGMALGSGPVAVINVAQLSNGQHTISLAATDEDGRVSTTSVSITTRSVLTTTPHVTAAGVTSAASFVTGITPGGLGSVFGTGIVSMSGDGVRSVGSLPLPRTLGGTTVLVDGMPVPIYAIATQNGSDQINVQFPYELASESSATVVVLNNGIATAPITVPVLAAQPGVFTIDGATGIIVHSATNQLATPTNPARPGEFIILYATGLGVVSPAPETGAAALASPLSVMPTFPTVTIGGLNATVLWAGLTPGFAGLYQINATVPASITSGNLPVIVTASGQSSKPVTMAVTGNVTCSYGVTASSTSFLASGGNGTANVTTANGCSWTATSDSTWLSVTSGASGNGNGTVGYAVSANPNTAQRSGVLTIANQKIAMAQAGAGCNYTLSAVSATFGPDGGYASVTVTAPTGCAWAAESVPSWIVIISGSPGNGNGTVYYRVAPYSDAATRSGAFILAGQAVQVTQTGPSCSYNVTPLTASYAASGGSGSIAVAAPGGCAWTASTKDSWITISSGANGTGSGSVSYAVTANTGTARSGTVTVAGQGVIVTEAGATAATFSLDGVLANGDRLHGLLMIDTGTGVVTDLYLGAGLLTFTHDMRMPNQGVPGTNVVIVTRSSGQEYPDLAISLPQTTLVGYQGGRLCSNDAPCAQDGYNLVSGLSTSDKDIIWVRSGVLVPEPSVTNNVAGNGLYTVSPANLTLTAVQGGSATGTVVVQNSSGTPLTINVYDYSVWAAVAPTGLITVPANGQVTLSVNATTAAAGVGTVYDSFTIFGSKGAPILVNVTMTVTR